MTATSVCIPRMSSICLLPLQEVLKDWQVGLIQVHFKLLMHSWIPKQVRFACAVYFFQPPGTPRVCPTGLQSQTFWGACVPAAGSPGLGSLMWDSDPSLLGRFLPLVDHLPRAVGLECTVHTPFLPSYCGSFLELLWKLFSATLQFVLIESCSVNGCNFRVPMGGGELKVFLFPLLGHIHPRKQNLMSRYSIILPVFL